MEWTEIRWQARERHAAALVATNGDRSANALVQAEIAAADLELEQFTPGTKFGSGMLGLLERVEGIVHVANTLPADKRAEVIAHELGHFYLHLDPRSEVTLGRTALACDASVTGAAKVEGYSERERKEVQANVYAGEFLCPSDWARDQFVRLEKKPSQIAAELRLPRELVLHQVIRAVLLPPLRSRVSAVPSAVHSLDDSQRIAATWSGGPLLVDAGPGTGKTRTLIHRISHLLAEGVPPSAILALTFSNKAAEEMRERLSAVHPQAAIEMWVGTFHAFGLELLTKWPTVAGRTDQVQVLDESDSLGLLEDHLAELPLQHYQNLFEPAFDLAPVLKAISRCKDELVSPAQYLAAAHAAQRGATIDDEREAAEKAIEVGEIYKVYEAALASDDAVDFGDLIASAIAMIRQNADVRQYVGGFKHVLVDEYQDVNFASSQLLQTLHEGGAKVWVVADPRQSIYRFRGAEPSNVERFAAEFAGTRHSLQRNYRSRPAVVEAFQQFSAGMGGGSMRGTWSPQRAPGGGVSLTAAPDVRAEAEAIHDRIQAFVQAGVPFSDQVILARSHRTLARITGVLEELGTPLLYLGDLFEREDVRDLLSLISIGAEPGGVGLVRVATHPAYGATRADAALLASWARDQKLHPFAALLRAAEISGLTEAGKRGCAKLGEELRGLEDVSAWTLLTTWLFERSGYLPDVLKRGNAKAQQTLIAIYHFLKVCSEQAATGNNSRKALLKRIRRLELLNQDTAYRAVASEAADVDAVRVMTIHGSKGLEFDVVHLPALSTTYMPSNRQGVRCPPPASLSRLALSRDGHEAEEECLFFVAMSRAKEFLSLSRADRYTGGRTVSASAFLSRLPASIRNQTRAGGIGPLKLQVLPTPVQSRTEYSVRELELYIKCPARYRYQQIDGFGGGPDGSAYVGFHGCVYATIVWMESERKSGRALTTDSAHARLEQEWKTKGPMSHSFEPYYLQTARDMVAHLVRVIARDGGASEAHEWKVSVNGRIITVSPDRVLKSARTAVTVQRIRTGKQTKSEEAKPIYALLRKGAQEQYPGHAVTVEILYLATGTSIVVDGRNDAKRLKEYADAIAGIEGGGFVPEPDARDCPNCPAYFACQP